MITKTKTNNHQVMENILSTMDNIKHDLEKCGMRLKDAMAKFELELFSNKLENKIVLI